MKAVCTMALLAGLAAGQAQAQTTLYLVNTQNLDPICDSLNPTFYVGSNPSAIALVGDRLIVGGYDNANNTILCQLVTISNIFGTRAFAVFNGQGFNHPVFRGYTGMHYRPGAGLLVSRDTGSGSDGSLKLFDIDTQVNPILRASSTGSLRGGCGASWDAGNDGLGYTYTDAQGATVTGPVAVALDWSQTAPLKLGPAGLDPNRLDYTSTVFEYDGGANGNNLRLDFTGLSGTFWRDVRVHPTNGTYAARANNDLVIGTRPNDNFNFVQQVLVDGGDAPFVQTQNVEIVSGAVGGDFVIYNSSVNTSAGQAFANVVKAVDMDGTPRTVAFVNPDGSPVSFPAGISWYDFSWDAANNRLAIMDFTNRTVWIFSDTQPTTPCAADFNEDGFVDFFDFDDFVLCFEGGGCPAGKTADYNNDGFIDFFDFDDFVLGFETGC
jgi:hypothetical protein